MATLTCLTVYSASYEQFDSYITGLGNDHFHCQRCDRDEDDGESFGGRGAALLLVAVIFVAVAEENFHVYALLAGNNLHGLELAVAFLVVGIFGAGASAEDGS